MVNIGYKNYVAADKIVSVMRIGTVTSQKIIEEAKKNNRFLDATFNHKTKSYILTNDKFVFASAVETQTLAGRITGVKGSYKNVACVIR